MFNSIKKLLTLVICFFLPIKFSSWVLNLLGHNINSNARVGFSLIWVEKISLGYGARIGHFNIIIGLKNINIAERGYLGYGNALLGPFSLFLKERGAIGNRNLVTRAAAGISNGNAVLELGILSKITSQHMVDCMCNLIVGDYTTFAGKDSQIWTHGYVHERVGAGRFRVDGEIIIGNNVYIGSRCVFNPGVRVADGVTIGSNSTISKSLLEQGLYVSQPLRRVDYDPDEIRSRLSRVEGNLIETVYEKKI